MPTTLTQGATYGDVAKWVVNDDFNIETVTLLAGTVYSPGHVIGKITASGKYCLSPHESTTGKDGAETATAIVLFSVDATSGDRTSPVLFRGPALISASALLYDESVDDANKRATKRTQLANVGLVSRTTA